LGAGSPVLGKVCDSQALYREQPRRFAASLDCPGHEIAQGDLRRQGVPP
jgi:hypothetical protein